MQIGEITVDLKELFPLLSNLRHISIVLILLFGGPSGFLIDLPSSVEAADFETDVAPILIQRCLECHKGPHPAGGLSLDSKAGLFAGGESGPSIKRGMPNDSYVIERINEGEMPPPVKGVPQNLSADEVSILKNWIADGAQWPEGRTLDLYEVTSDVRGGRDWWSFQPVERPAILRNPPQPGTATTDKPGLRCRCPVGR